MKMVNIDAENLDIIWTNWGISIKFSGKMWLMVMLRVTKNQSFTLSLDDTFLEKPQWGQTDSCSRLRVKINFLKLVSSERVRWSSLNQSYETRMMEFLAKIVNHFEPLKNAPAEMFDRVRDVW